VSGKHADQWWLAAEAIIYTITHTRSRSKKKWWSAEALHFDSEGAKDKISSDLPSSSFEQLFPNEAPLIRLLLKSLKENNILKILNPQAALQKHPIHTLESSKHPLNIVRLSL
jgi:hypothetical protein